MLYIFIPLGDLISSILFKLYFSYLYLAGDLELNYSSVVRSNVTRILCRLVDGLGPLLTRPHCSIGQNTIRLLHYVAVEAEPIHN